jgi:hypothetical protein
MGFFRKWWIRDGGKGLEKWESPIVCLYDWFKNLQITTTKLKNHPKLIVIKNEHEGLVSWEEFISSNSNQHQISKDKNNPPTWWMRFQFKTLTLVLKIDAWIVTNGNLFMGIYGSDDITISTMKRISNKAYKGLNIPSSSLLMSRSKSTKKPNLVEKSQLCQQFNLVKLLIGPCLATLNWKSMTEHYSFLRSNFNFPMSSKRGWLNWSKPPPPFPEPSISSYYIGTWYGVVCLLLYMSKML